MSKSSVRAAVTNLEVQVVDWLSYMSMGSRNHLRNEVIIWLL